MAVTRRRMSVGELSVWRSLVDTTTELRRRLSVQLAEESGLSPADYQVLLALSEAEGKRSRSTRLAEQMAWERSRLSHHLGRMEKRGLIKREDCATDNRGAEVVLTEEGATAFRRATAPHTKAIKRYFADALTPEQLDALADVLASLEQHLVPRVGSSVALPAPRHAPRGSGETATMEKHRGRFSATTRHAPDHRYH